MSLGHAQGRKALLNGVAWADLTWNNLWALLIFGGLWILLNVFNGMGATAKSWYTRAYTCPET